MPSDRPSSRDPRPNRHLKDSAFDAETSITAQNHAPSNAVRCEATDRCPQPDDMSRAGVRGQSVVVSPERVRCPWRVVSFRNAVELPSSRDALEFVVTLVDQRDVGPAIRSATVRDTST